MAHPVLTYMDTVGVAPPLPEAEARRIAGELGQLSGLAIYPRSITAAQQALFALGRRKLTEEKYLVFVSPKRVPDERFIGRFIQVNFSGVSMTSAACTTTPANAAALRDVLPFLVPQTIGRRKSAGCGDRLGLATPGHVRAVRHWDMAPIFPQQSMRENARTGRTPQQVIDDAMWGVFEEGWRDGYGADADHLKTTDDIDICAAAGYTFYTVDPGEYVDNSANNAPPDALRQKAEVLPWDILESSVADLERQLGSKPIDLDGFSLTISKEELLRAAAKYGRAVAHTVTMYRYLSQLMSGRPFELEMSVDETETVSTLAEHAYIAHELKRTGVKWVSLAPRYVGDFEKGVDYMGDLGAFERSFARHLAVSKAFGPYKLSLHSGSDKFSIYPIASRVADDLVHLKTAGTSYLEALRAIASLNPALFRTIVSFAIDRYPADRASYHVSADAAKVPNITSWPDAQLAELLDDFHGREVLHVTFGSVLNHQPFREPFFSTLRRNEDTYYQILERHFDKHLAPFGKASASANR